MKRIFFALLCCVIGCAHASKADDPEKRAMPKAPEAAAESAPTPESMASDLLRASALARSVREHVGAMLATLPSGGRTVCGTPEFEKLNTTIGGHLVEIVEDVKALEEMVATAGKSLPKAELAALMSAMETGEPLCQAETICASPDSERACYEVARPYFLAIRAYAYALAALLK